MNDKNELVCMRTFNERTRAELVKAYLEAYGVEAVIGMDHGVSLPYSTTSSGYPCILVHSRDAAEAKRLLEEADKNEDESGNS